MFRATEDEVKEFLSLCNGWKVKDGKLHKRFLFPNFKSAFQFMTSIAEYSGQHNHHPEWFNVYNRVEIYLTTHEVSGISSLDFAMAEYIDLKAQEFQNNV